MGKNDNETSGVLRKENIMNMSEDTAKSLGYLEKSLKMSRRAIEKNQQEDGSSSVELDAMKASMQRVLDQINIWKGIPVVAPASPIPTSDEDASDLVQ